MRWVVVLVLAGLVCGCKKEAKPRKTGSTALSDSQAAANRAAIDAAVPPKWFAHIPVDTPLLITSFVKQDDRAQETLVRMMALLSGKDCETLGASAAGSSCPAAPVANPGCEHLTVDGMEKIGLGRAPRFAFYANGLSFAARIDVADPKAAVAVMEKHAGILRNGGYQVNSGTGAVSYWENRENKGGWWVGTVVFADHMAIVSAPWEFREEGRAHLLETDPKGMADARKLKTIARQAGYPPGLMGYFDFEAIAEVLGPGDGWRHHHGGFMAKNFSFDGCDEAFASWSSVIPMISFSIDGVKTKDIKFRARIHGKGNPFVVPTTASAVRQWQIGDFDDSGEYGISVAMAKTDVIALLEGIANRAPRSAACGLPSSALIKSQLSMMPMVPDFQSMLFVHALGDTGFGMAGLIEVKDSSKALPMMFAADIKPNGKYQPFVAADMMLRQSKSGTQIRARKTEIGVANGEAARRLLDSARPTSADSSISVLWNGKLHRKFRSDNSIDWQFPASWLGLAIDRTLIHGRIESNAINLSGVITVAD